MTKHVIISNKGLTYEGSIDDAKDLAIELGKLASESGNDLSKILSDFIFEIESTYQRYYNLDPDDWGKIE